MSSHEPWRVRALRFVRAVLVGGGATLTDFSVFMSCVRGFGIAPASARLPALLAGASIQFFGSRHFAFRAGSGSLSRQARLFVAFEAVSVGLNWVLFQTLLPRFPRLPPELVTLLASSSVFLLFNYPTRRLVIFRLPGAVGVPGRHPNPATDRAGSPARRE